MHKKTKFREKARKMDYLPFFCKNLVTLSTAHEEQEEKEEKAPLKYFHELSEEMQEKFAKIGQNSTKIPAFLPKKATEEMSYEKHRREIQKTMEKENKL